MDVFIEIQRLKDKYEKAERESLKKFYLAMIEILIKKVEEMR